MEMMIGSPPGEGKMVIKLKISKPKEEGKRVCLECKKEFSSAKALGGHMRVHAHDHDQSTKQNPNHLKPSTATDHQFKKTKPYYMNSVNEEGKPSCSLCGKTFPSMKSLFGHMRCHPERVWRGILPPPPNTPSPTARRRPLVGKNQNGLNVNKEEEVVDLTKCLPGWSVTERRGRKALKPADDDEDNEEEVLLDAVEDLMSLAKSGVEMTEESSEELLINYKSGSKIKRRKKMKLMMELELEQEVVNECKYKCTTCNKSFTTHQALGGHRSSHNKYSKFTPTDHHQVVQDDHEKEIELAPASGTANSGVHGCKICGKVFATGQALGGHKRCHWIGTSEVQAPSSQITSAGEAGSQTGSGRKVFEFDLNEMPPMMMEEDEGGNGNGYASSSYNSNMG